MINLNMFRLDPNGNLHQLLPSLAIYLYLAMRVAPPKDAIFA